MTPAEGCHPRRLTAMRLTEIAALPDKERAVVVLTTGAIEQHGRHLPVAVDALMGEVWLERALAMLPTDFACYLAPPITIGRSVEHAGFPGTLTVSKETLRLQFLAIARQLNAWGFRRLAVHNTHGGNLAVLGYTLREIEATLGLRASLLQPQWDFELSLQEATFGFHAGELETSWILVAAGELVDMSEARCEWPAQIDQPGVLRPEVSPARVAWITRDLSESGVMGDATVATREKGERWLEHGARCLAAAIVAAAD
jgi:creatinine amidohydrolase